MGGIKPTRPFDRSHLSNAGKEASRAHRQLRRVADKILDLVADADAAGLSSAEVEQAFLRFCTDREQIADAASLFLAALKTKEATAGGPRMGG